MNKNYTGGSIARDAESLWGNASFVYVIILLPYRFPDTDDIERPDAPVKLFI